MLSEKAKGKQREIDLPLDQPSSSTPPNDSRDLTIRFTEGIPDFSLTVRPKHTVRDVKANIVIGLPQLKDRRLRLIHAGRLLTDGTLLHEWLTTLEERQERASARSQESSKEDHLVTWLHCSVGPQIEPGESEEEKPQVAQLQPLRGFDRLTAAGFSEEDIANFRRQFHSQSSLNYLDIEFENEEDYDEHARALEEQWIDSMDSVNTAALSSASSQSLILRGIVIGFFFPIIPFFFLRETKAAVFWDEGEHESGESVIFSRRTQVGIVFGFLVNLLFGMWRYLLDTS
ncbi:DUF2407 C-terminal domain-containing protein [Suillus paluster]|uniref:DUF2407 C-terminal domain-containing protein n=1 Tax=Suillus paluster TaxID=48578 RepID=UPI001B86ECB1|nr:DUF2407 C-terminal domain-containing protein [Suillus paluster]KAG1723036.1 DUF2407 C-terminal domain-containing protein [Suillus paluster]